MPPNPEQGRAGVWLGDIPARISADNLMWDLKTHFPSLYALQFKFNTGTKGYCSAAAFFD